MKTETPSLRHFADPTRPQGSDRRVLVNGRWRKVQDLQAGVALANVSHVFPSVVISSDPNNR